MKTKEISTGPEFERIIGEGVALIDFDAPWCAPCRAQGPIIDKLARHYRGRAFVGKMNVQNNQETAAKLGIRSIPTLAVFKNGHELQRLVGLQPESALSAAIEQALR